MEDQSATDIGTVRSQKWLLIAVISVVVFAVAIIIPTVYFFRDTSGEPYSPDRVWRSTDLEFNQDGEQAVIPSSRGDQQATFEFYEASPNQLGTAVTEFSVYTNDGHPDPFNRVSELWHGEASAYPYAGQSSVGRGDDDGEDNAPNPVGVLDLQLHPPDSANVTVAAFVVPADGVYLLRDIGARRVLEDGGSATLRVSVDQNAPLMSLSAESQSWIVDDDIHMLSSLTAGQRIYFALDADGDFSSDAVEVAWTIAAISPAPDESVRIESNFAGSHAIVNGQDIVLPAVVPVIDDSPIEMYVPSPQTTADGQTIAFDDMSDGSMGQAATLSAGSEISVTFQSAEAEPMLVEGFESEDESTQIDISAAENDLVEPTDEYLRSGSRALKVMTTAEPKAADAVAAFELPESANTIYVSFFLALPRNYYLLDGSSHTLLALDGSDGEPALLVELTDNYELAVRLQDSTGTLHNQQRIGAPVPLDSAWHAIQIRLTVDAEHGQVEVWLDGEKLLDRRELDTGSAGEGDIGAVRWGVIAPRPDNGVTFYLDDLTVSSSFVQTKPVGAFVSDVVATGFTLPTYATFTPDGRIFVAQKDGTIFVVDNGEVLPEPLIKIPQVNTWGDRGLISIALDPNFEENGYVYASYTFDVDPADFEGPKTARISRFTLTGNTADPASEFVLLGTVNGTPEAPSCEDYPKDADCIPSDDKSHSGGNLLFMPDGSLLASLGEGASEEYVDPRSLRAQDLDVLGGKIVRINPANGEGYPDNPFYTGDPTDNRSKIWAYGFRNAFRFVLKPGTSTIYGGDVGWAEQEEIDVIQPGENYGWPCFEGDEDSSYMQFDQCQVLAETETTIPPIYSYPHPPGVAVVGGDFYLGNDYPSEYQGAFFFGDYGYSAIWTLSTDGNDELVGEVKRFPLLPDGPVQIFSGPDGDIYYLSIFTGELRHIRYKPPSDRPSAGN